ncbi:HK97 gp10 family phage protein [Cytobacillus solani]|uniref:HK97-gp10 family putative phage morphogenesis protein n=1 Tax=Cytobacillus solani TaxID=1637975 RepID=UPI0020798A03|nr:HK97-gp10 family putative phage morphogenesis protein [Cytobacillus solani]USK56574.1 HK97 gp10 family phage protein [Cytobacillus solani]
MAFDLQGMNQLLQQIQQMGRAVDTHVKEKALKEGGNFMKDKVKAFAPERTGKLKENIAVSDVIGDEIAVGIDQQGDAFYAHILEFGRKAGVAKIKRKGKKIDYPYPAMAPKPFIGPAFENNKQAVQDIMGDVIKRELNL